MVYTPIPIGSLAWGTPVNNAFTSQDARITANEAAIASLRSSSGVPSDQGLQAWTFDPGVAQNNVVLTPGTVNMAKVFLNAGSVTAVGFLLSVVGVTLTAGQNFVGIYDGTGTRLGVSADQTASWGTLGYKQATLVSPAVIPSAGFYYLAVLCNAATGISVIRGSNPSGGSGFVNFNLTNATARFANGPTAQTSLPASVTMASRTPASPAYWMTAA